MMSCLVNTVALTCLEWLQRWYWSSVSSNSPGSGGFVQDSEAGCVKAQWRCGTLVASLSAWPSHPWSPATWPSAPAYSVIRNRGQQPQAQLLSLYILLAVDMVKIISDVLGTLCRSWLILDSSFLKFILSIRPPFDFILGPKTFLISYVYIFLTNNSPRKFSKWPLGILLIPSQFPACQGHF